MRSRTSALVALAGAIALAMAPARVSAQITLFANLTNSQEVPPTVPTLSTGGPRPASFGFATFVLNAAQTQLSMSVTIFNVDVTGMQTADVNDNLVNAHIHVGAPPGSNASVRWGFFGSPFNNTTPNDGTLTPFTQGVGGTFTGTWDAPEGNGTTLSAQVAGILAGQAYINFHTVQFGAGEIRGQILVTPEPSTVLLTAAGLGALLFLKRRRRSSSNTGA